MRRVNNLPIVYKKPVGAKIKEVRMRKKKSGVMGVLRRVFHVKQNRVSAKQRQKIRQEIIEGMIRERKEMIVDGQHYEAAVEKYEEQMMATSLKWPLPEDSPLTEVAPPEFAFVIRCSKIPEFLLSLGVRING